ncbi:MAG: hypothetical protein ACLFTQ_01845 [Candidatus Aenigmatarchaeota archaeon]
MLRGKGQYLSLEQMLLFTISVIIMVLIYQSFSAMAENTGETVIEDQLKEVGEIAMSGIHTAYRSYEEDGNRYMRIRAKIPKEISSDMYKIKVEGDGDVLKVVDEMGNEITKPTGFVSEDVNISMHENFIHGVSSRKGNLIIELDEDEIRLGR